MSNTVSSPIDKRFSPTPKGVRLFTVAYPVVVVGGAGWFRESPWFWWAAVFCAIGWLSAVWQFLANTHRREGYGAAVEDMNHNVASQRFHEDMLAGKIPLTKRADL
jgi:hypothetical protein